jgi:lipopolysaccharide export system protein LptC
MLHQRKIPKTRKRRVIMKKIILTLSILLSIFLMFSCQSTSVPSATTTSPESSIGEAEELSYDHTRFTTTDELVNYIKQNSAEEEIMGVKIQNFIKDGQIKINEPTFTPPTGFKLYSVEIWTVYGSYTYITDKFVDYLEEIKSSNQAAAESMSYPKSSYETKDEIPNINRGLLTSSGETASLSDYEKDAAFRAENRIIMQWSTEKSEKPGAALTWCIENFNLKPIGNDEKPTYYYSLNDSSGIPVSYCIYWETDGYLCYATIPAALFSEEAVAEICSFKTVTVPLG